MMLPLNTAEKTKYCESWSHNASTFSAQGCYQWMFDQVSQFKPERVLEVGCGTGEGLIELLSRSVKSVVSIEENFDCIKVTERKLREMGHDVSVVPRLGYLEKEDGRHDIVIDQDEIIRENSRITLIHGDILLYGSDMPLTNYLRGARSFDAIVCWLMGTFEMRKTCRVLDGLKISDAGDYRLKVQNRVYEIAEIVLKKGGVMQTVDRGVYPLTKEYEQIAFQGHQEQASTTSLLVKEFASRPYLEPEKGMGMTSFSKKLPIKDNGKRGMHSMVSLKP